MPRLLAQLGTCDLMTLSMLLSGLLPYSPRDDLLWSVNLTPGEQFMASWVRSRPTSGPVSGTAIGQLSSDYYVVVFQSPSCVWLFMTPWTAECQAPLPSLPPGVCSKSCPLTQWFHPTISSSVAPFSCPQSFPASGSFPVSWLFTSGGQSIRVSASASILPINIQGWFPLGWTGWISLQPKGLSRVFSGTTVQKHHSLVLNLLYGPALTFIWQLEKP